ncbi:MAG: hypothetical protein M0Q26_11020 [Chitinophagaceae bacterium]|nr:hypothetical protein [Chitinophagaceae bacterium]
MKFYTTYTDGELVRMLRQGDRAAFTEVYNRFGKSYFTWLVRSWKMLGKRKISYRIYS